MNKDIFGKIAEYNNAMHRYYKYSFYNKSGIFVASFIVILQVITLVNCLKILTLPDLKLLPIILFLAYLFTDFINGLVHMYMDNNTNYKSFTGPFAAAFHLHHKTPRYRDSNLFKVYFFESGSKWWLLVYLVLLCVCQIILSIPITINIFLVLTGVLSSVAEVSHYWCHNSKKDQKLLSFLQKTYILLPKTHHAKHHSMDNVNYCFLNGATDPIINWIAKYLYDGYKNNADMHVNFYKGEQKKNR